MNILLDTDVLIWALDNLQEKIQLHRLASGLCAAPINLKNVCRVPLIVRPAAMVSLVR